MIKFALKYYNGEDGQDTFRQVDLAPSENIFSLSCTKSMSLSLSPPQLLLPSSLTPPALRSRCSCPQPLQPSPKACPFTAQIEKAGRRKAVVIAISASVDRSWPLLPSCGLATCTLDLISIHFLPRVFSFAIESYFYETDFTPGP